MSSKPTILLIGGTGKVASSIAQLLKEHGHPTILASRKGTAPAAGFTSCRFDWLDSKTFNVPFEKAQNIASVFLTAPAVMDVFPPMKAFIDFARPKGIKRFVLLSASVFKAGGPAMGQVHQYLIDLRVDYTVLRPSWFMENFSTEMRAARFDEDKGEVYSSTGKGKIPWISVKDIGAVGYRALVDEVSHNTEHILLGSELLSYDDTARILTEVIGKKVTHVNLPEQDFVRRLISAGLSEDHATVLGGLEGFIKQGGEERLNDVVLQITGRPPRTFREYAEISKSEWIP